MLREFINQDVLTLIIVSCMLIITITKLLFPKRFNEFVMLLINSRYSSQYVKEQSFFDLFEALLFLNLILNISVLLFLFLPQFTLESITQLSLFKYSIIIGVFFILKVMFERLLSSILDIEPIIDKYLFQKISFRNFIGLLLLPINMFLLYTIGPNKTIFIIVISLLFLIFFLGVFLFAKNNLNTFKKSFFYFILYLCTLEITPYVVLYEFITT